MFLKGSWWGSGSVRVREERSVEITGASSALRSALDGDVYLSGRGGQHGPACRSLTHHDDILPAGMANIPISLSGKTIIPSAS